MRHRWDDFELDTASRRLVGLAGDVHIEPQVFDVLLLLVEERDRVVPKEEILDAVWGDQFVSESALTTRIKEARRALGDDGRTQKYIRNAHGHGYQFVGVVDALASPVHSTAPNEAAAPVPLRLAIDITVDDEFPFVGRTAELVAAESLLEEARRVGARLFIGGPPGVGKSRLAIELLERASRNGRLVCAGRCDEQIGSALQPARDSLSQLVSAHPHRVQAWCAGVEGPLISLIPSLGAHLPHESVPVDAYGAIDVFLTVFERVVADAPLVLLVDDLQWSDDVTRAFLGRLHRRMSESAFAGVYTFRSGKGDLPQEVRSWIRSQARAGVSHRISLGDLEGLAAHELVDAVLGAGREGAMALVDATAGNCLFLTESIRDFQLGASTADSVAELVVARVERQSEDVRVLIRAGALLGHEFSFATAASVADLEPSAALSAIGEAVDAELLHETMSPERFRFSHQLVPQAILDSLSRQARSLVHSRCVEALTSEGADEVEIAFHILGAIPLVRIEEAVAAGREAADLAIEANQFDRAVRLLQRVLDVGVPARTRAEIIVRIGESVVARGTPGAAVVFFEEAAELARRNGWPDILADAALGHWGQSPFRRLSDRSTLKLLREADVALGDEPSLRKAKVRAKMSVFSLFITRLGYRADRVAAAIEMAPQASGIDRMKLLESQAVVFTCPAGVDHLDVIDPELEELRLTHFTYFADAAAPETRYLMRGMGAELRAVTEVDAVRTRVQPISEWRSAVLRSTLAAFDGEFDLARRFCDEGGATGEPYWGESSYPLHALGRIFIASVSDDWVQAAEMLDLLVGASGAPVLVPSQAWALAAAGDHDRAAEALGRLRSTHLAWFGEHILGGNALIAAGEVALLIGDDELAASAFAHLLPFKDIVLGVPWACSFAAADTLSRLAAHRGEIAEAAAFADRARELYTSLDAPTLIARLDP